MPRKKNPNSGYVKPDYHANNNKKNQSAQEKKKKAKLRTSLDIYNRLMHGGTLGIDLNNVYIAYVDNKRQEIVETPITKWRMIEKGGDVPMHCIVFFVLYFSNGKPLKIWDRESRLDRLYCSGNTTKEQSIGSVFESMQNEEAKTKKIHKKIHKSEKIVNKQRKIHNKKIICKEEKENLSGIAQKFKYLVVLDFEATCQKNGKISPQEIIEWPAIIIDTETFEILESKWFHCYIKPKHNPILTDFCTELTGITQKLIDEVGSKNTIKSVLNKWNKWCYDNNLLPETADEPKATIVTCGDWDLKTMWTQQQETSKCGIAALFHSWIDIKNIFNHNKNKILSKQFQKKKVRGMMAMLECLNIEHEGRHHSGIDDVKNICKIVQALLKKGIRFDYTVTQFIGRSICDDVSIRAERECGNKQEPRDLKAVSMIDQIDECILLVQTALASGES